MSGTKRVPVPRVEKPKAPPIPEPVSAKTVADNTPPIIPERIEDMASSNFVKKAITAISNNRETIKRKAIIGIGTGVGMVIASAVVDRLGGPTTEVVYIEANTVEIPTDSAKPARAKKTVVVEETAASE